MRIISKETKTSQGRHEIVFDEIVAETGGVKLRYGIFDDGSWDVEVLETPKPLKEWFPPDVEPK